MKLFYKNILKFLLLNLVVFFCIQFSLDCFLKSDLICDNTMAKVFKGELNTDIVIIGNSRAEVHYNPDIISEITKKQCYNLGVSGTPINIFDIKWNAFINNNKLPSILIIDVDYNFLGEADGVFEKYQYLPYVNKEEYEVVVKGLDDNLFKDQYFPLYKYRDNFMPVVSIIKSAFFNKCDTKINGFKIKKKIWDDNEWGIFKKNRMNEVAEPKTFNKLYNKGYNKLSSLLGFCKKNNIKAVLIWSPQYIEVQDFKRNQRDFVDGLINKLATEFEIDYLNFSNDSLVNNKSNFYNHSHLNYNGANEFSKSVANYIKKI